MDILEYKEFPSNIKAFTTLKDIKKELSFSLALHTMQDPIKVDKNRKELLKFFSIPKVLSLRQIHSNKVVDIDNISLNSNLWEDLDIEADGMVTSKKNIALAIFSADCIGALLYDPISNIIGAYHAGWRGSYLNITSNIIELMVKKGAKPKNIKVAISPHIKSCCYEVDSKVASKFKEYKDAIRIVDKNIFLSIEKVNITQLLNSGVKKNNIKVSSFCTSCNNRLFFSYRKEKTKGRFISLIMRGDV